MSGPRFVEPPAWTYRRRPLLGPGILALVGAVAAALFLVVLATRWAWGGSRTSDPLSHSACYDPSHRLDRQGEAR